MRFISNDTPIERDGVSNSNCWFIMGQTKTKNNPVLEEIERKYFKRPKFELKEDIKYLIFGGYITQ